jgi:hypothetical protein
MVPPYEDSEAVAWVRTYVARGVPADLWQVSIQPFVLECIGALGVPVPVAKRYARVLAGLCLWCLGEGLPLKREVVLDPDVVERYALMVLRHRRGGATSRSDLRRLGPLLTRDAPWEPRPRPMARRRIAAPYNPAELVALWHMVGLQRTDRLRAAGQAIFLLGVGLGLDGRWAPAMTANDFGWRNGLLVAAIGDPCPREVPVLDHYSADMAELLANAGEGRLVGGDAYGKNAVSNLVDRLRTPSDTPRLSASRLRSTWLLTLLERGVRLPELVSAAGIEGLTPLSDLLDRVPRLGRDEYLEEIGGPR